MPRYTYICHDCDADFEVRLSYAEVDEARPACPDCDSTHCTRALSRASISTGSQFASGGFAGSDFGSMSSASSCGCGNCSGGSCGTCNH